MWWQDATIYQIYTRSFRDSNGDGIGDLGGILEKLDYLEDLGVDAVWLNPIYPSPDRDFGYDIEEYCAIHPQYGTLEDFDTLVEELHSRGMKIIMDLVVNHTSDRHPWFGSSESEPDGPYGDFYIWKPGKNGGPPNNWESFFGGPAWKYSPLRGEYYLHLFSENQADLDWDNPEVRAEVYRIIRWWKERRIDGFRMDVINMVSKDPDFPDDLRDLTPPAIHGTQHVMNGPNLHDYLQEMHGEVLEEKHMFSVGECPGAQYEDVLAMSGYERGELDAVMQMELMEIDHGPGGKWDIQPWTVGRFMEIIEKWQTGLEDRACPANFLANHDQPRPLSRFGDEVRYRYESATLLAALLLSLTGTVFLYYGDEIGMTNAAYPDLQSYRDVDTLNFYRIETERGKAPEDVMEAVRYMSRDNARSPMQWSGRPGAGFSSGEPWMPVAGSFEDINVEAEQSAGQKERTAGHTQRSAERASRPSVLGFYRRMIALRRETPALRRGYFLSVPSGHERCFAFIKHLEDACFLVFGNFGGEPAVCKPEIPAELYGGSHPRPVISNHPIAKEQWPNMELHPYEARIYRL